MDKKLTAVCVLGAIMYCALQAGLAVDIVPVFDPSISDAQKKVINAKIDLWENRLPHQSPEHTVTITFENVILTQKAMFRLGTESQLAAGSGTLKMAEETSLAETNEFTEDSHGLPTGARIRINGNSAIPWYVDSNDPPGTADGNVPSGQYDLWTVINHELCHALGFTINYSQFEQYVEYVDPNHPDSSLRRFNFGGDPNATLVPEVTGPNGTHLDPGYHPDDMMNPELPPGVRRHPSPLDVNMLNYSIWIDKARQPIPENLRDEVLPGTDLEWGPTQTATAQAVYFGTDSGALTLVKTGNFIMDKVTNAELGGPLAFNTRYYWRVDSNIGGVYVNGSIWHFTTESDKATNPTPANGQEKVTVCDVNLMWTASSAAQNFNVYFSSNKSLVDSGNPAARIRVGDTVNEANIAVALRNQDFYWRVDCNYAEGIIQGDTWQFRTESYEIVINTQSVSTSYEGHTFGPNSILVHGNSWFALKADGNSTNQPTESNVLGEVEGTGSDSVLVFDFNTFNYDRRFDIVVIPQYRASDINATNFIRPIAIHVHKKKSGASEGSFKFDGRMNISGMDVTYATDNENELKGRCGGYPGPKRNSGTSSPIGSGGIASDYWTPYTILSGNYTRFGSIETDKPVFLPTALAYSLWGPGQPDSPPYKVGGGGGYGGIGGDSGRGYWAGTFSGGASYGDEEAPVPFGGSSGGWGVTSGGCAGGGGIEIVADANLTLDANSVINANGGSSINASGYMFSNGGGAGGSVRLIADRVTLKGVITANGGKGGNAASDRGERDAGGGGAGGRIAVFYTTGYSRPGTVSVAGGQAGVAVNTNTTLAENGQDGTIFETSENPQKASAPTPRDGDRMVYAPTAGTQLTLRWYAGYEAASDEVYFSTIPNTNPANDPTKKVAGGPITTPTRGQRSAGATVTIDPNKTYYFQVKTDGTTDSDAWSFSTVDWKCEYVSDATPHIKGPEWDSNGDCVLNDADFWYFAQYWRDTARSVDHTLDGDDLYRFVEFWLECFNRTDNGCTDHLW